MACKTPGEFLGERVGIAQRCVEGAGAAYEGVGANAFRGRISEPGRCPVFDAEELQHLAFEGVPCAAFVETEGGCSERAGF